MQDPAGSLFFFNDTATTEIYTLSLHDALPICARRLRRCRRDRRRGVGDGAARTAPDVLVGQARADPPPARSEEHTSELQSRQYLVCRLLLAKKHRFDAVAVTLHERGGLVRLAH